VPHKNATERRNYHKRYMRSYAIEKRARGLCRQYGCANRSDREYCEQHRARQLELNSRARAECYAGYGGKCECCGDSNPMFLTLDHRDDDGAKMRAAGEYATTLYRKLKRLGFPKTFRLLCFNCNCGRYRNGGCCPHEGQFQCASIT